MEPFKLRQWKLPSLHGSRRFYTCARPGRSLSRTESVADDVVHKWVNGLPGPKTAIVSLLGSKPDRTSEFSFYSFRSELDSERGRRPSFREWLHRFHEDKSIVVVEHPTIDFAREIPADRFGAIVADIVRLTDDRTVVLVDSGGEQRSGEVCRRIGAKEDFSLGAGG